MRVWPGIDLRSSALPNDRDAERVQLLDVVGTDTVRVSLALGERRVVGEAAVSTGSSVPEAAAKATLQALEELTPDAVQLDLHWCGVTTPAPGLPEIVTVLVGVDIAGVPMRYPGAVVVRDDVGWAAASSVLKALNRRLEIMHG